jgi:osmotically inducible protein OsmC
MAWASTVAVVVPSPAMSEVLDANLHMRIAGTAFVVKVRRSQMVRKARAVWRGTGKDGKGDLTTDSGVLSRTPYSYKARFENERGTNPEELIAAAHAGCFTMALAFELQTAGFEPVELATEAAVSLVAEGQGFSISRSALTLKAQVPAIQEAKLLELARNAKKELSGV